MRAFLLIVGFLMVAALTALFAGPVLVDWNAYRGTFEKEATALLGREVRVGGNASLRLLPAPYLHFDNVRIADQTGRFDNPLIRVDGFTIWLSVPPLLRGAVEAREIELEGPDVRLSVDEAGNANWHGLAAGSQVLPFVPTEVSLASVKVRNGRISIARSGVASLVSLEAIDGELAASALSGPYRFRGTVGIGGATHEVRVSTAALGGDHSLRVKTVVRAREAGRLYVFDGELLGLDSLPRLEGAVEAQFGLSPGAIEPPDDADPHKPVQLAASAMRLTGQLQADIAEGALTDISLTFESDNRPQQVTGEIAFEWSRDVSIGARLAARWLDLDRISGRQSAIGPWPALETYVGQFLSAFAANAKTRLVARIDQAQLGGELIGDVAIDAKRTEAGIELAALTATLPGTTRLSVSGSLTEQDGAERFAGPIRLSGTSLAKLLKWSMPALDLAAASGNGFYMLSGEADLTRQSLRLDRLMLEVDRSRISGALTYQGGAPGKLALSLDGDRLDLGEVIDAPPSLPKLLSGLVATDMPAADTQADGSLLAVATRFVGTVDADVKLRIGDLKTKAGRVENLALIMQRSGGRVDIDQIVLRTGSGLALQAAGSFAGNGDDADGLLRFRVEAPNAMALDTLGGFVALPEHVLAPARRFAIAAPLRLAGSIRRDKGGGAGRTEINIDGSSAGARLSMRLRGDRSLAELAQGQTDLVLSLGDSDSLRLMSRLSGRSIVAVPPELRQATGAGPGELTIRASGVPGTSMAVVAGLDAEGTAIGFQGSATFGDQEPHATGDINISLSSIDDTLASLGLTPLGEASPGMRLSGRIDLREAGLAIGPLNGEIDGIQVSGDAKARFAEDGPEIEASLVAGRVRLARLLAPLLAADPISGLSVDAGSKEEAVDAPQPAGEGAEDSGDPIVWSDRPFSLDLLKGWRARLAIKTGTIEILDGLVLEDASVQAESAADTLTLTKLAGNALGGEVAISGHLKRGKAGARLDLAASVKGAELEELFADDDGRAKGQGAVEGTLSLAASGLTPRGMVAVLEGQGALSITDGKIDGLSPVTVDQTARQLLSGDAKIDQEAIAKAIGEARHAADLPLGRLTTKLSVVDGALRAEPVSVETDQAVVRLSGGVDLSTLRLSSNWTIAPKPAETGIQPLPPVTIVYEGPISEITTLAAEADVEVLERELLARQIIGGEEQLKGLWPDAPARFNEGMLPDADRAAPIPVLVEPAPAVEGGALEPILAEPAGTKKAKKSATRSKASTQSEAQALVSSPSQVVKPKRKPKRKKLTVRESDNVGLR
ncbi:MAG: AsmA family protein [Hyphomicrobiaceae bacterium]